MSPEREVIYAVLQEQSDQGFDDTEAWRRVLIRSGVIYDS